MPDNFYLDRSQRRLFRAGAVFDPTARRWTASDEPPGEPVGLRGAVHWLQTESGSPCRVPVAVIGPSGTNDAERQTAFSVGAGLPRLESCCCAAARAGLWRRPAKASPRPAACQLACSRTASGGRPIGL